MPDEAAHPSADPTNDSWQALDTSTGRAVVTLGGDQNLAEAPRVELILQAAIDTGLPVVVDLAECTVIDESIFEAIFRAAPNTTHDGDRF